MGQLDLFSDAQGQTIPGFEKAKSAKDALPKKRIHNSIPTYTKTYENYKDSEGNVFDDEETWGRMNKLYTRLFNQFPYTHSLDEFKDFGIVRSRITQFTPETYTYKGTQYKGDDFKVYQAEIIGSELLGIEERVFLHESLLEYIEEGYKIEQLNGWIESLLNLCLQGFSARTIILMLILWRLKNENS